MKKKTLIYLGGFALLGLAAYQTKRKVTQAVYQAGIEARTEVENAILTVDSALWGVPSALGKWYIEDVLGVWKDEPRKSYNWLEGSDGRWPGI